MTEYRNHESLPVLKTSHYGKHVSAMTGEDLYSKGEIAEELAWRDIQIERLTAQLAVESRIVQDQMGTIHELQMELAECRKDAERLDWLSRQDERQVKIATSADAYWYMRMDGTNAATGYPSPRSMLDAAMETKP